jgi:hypothetical protein
VVLSHLSLGVQAYRYVQSNETELSIRRCKRHDLAAERVHAARAANLDGRRVIQMHPIERRGNLSLASFIQAPLACAWCCNC